MRELRGGLGYGYPDRHCPGCGTGLMTAERCTIPGCPQARRARGGNLSGRAAEALLDGQVLDPAQARTEACKLEARRLGAADRPNLTGHEALIMCQALGIGGVGHEPGWPG